jgi:hypothetical protein
MLEAEEFPFRDVHPLPPPLNVCFGWCKNGKKKRKRDAVLEVGLL